MPLAGAIPACAKLFTKIEKKAAATAKGMQGAPVLAVKRLVDGIKDIVEGVIKSVMAMAGAMAISAQAAFAAPAPTPEIANKIIAMKIASGRKFAHMMYERQCAKFGHRLQAFANALGFDLQDLMRGIRLPRKGHPLASIVKKTRKDYDECMGKREAAGEALAVAEAQARGGSLLEVSSSVGGRKMSGHDSGKQAAAQDVNGYRAWQEGRRGGKSDAAFVELSAGGQSTAGAIPTFECPKNNVFCPATLISHMFFWGVFNGLKGSWVPK